MTNTMWTRRHAIAGLAALATSRTAPGLSSPLLSPPILSSPVSPDAGPAASETRNWPSILDALPVRIQAAVRDGTHGGDVSRALRDAIETGSDLVVPPGVYPIAGDMLEVRKPGQRIVGTGGVLRRLAEADGIGLLVSASDAALHDLRLDGTAPARTPGHHNDTVKVCADGVTIAGLSVRGSQGSNLRLDGVRRCRVVRPTLFHAYQNNIIVCNAPTSDVVIDRPTCRHTVTQDNIFVTASEGSTDNGEFVSRIVINDPDCADAGDTGIELGYHCQDCRVTGGRVANSTRPALLQRDGRRNRWSDIVVANKPPADQMPEYDGVAVVPQWEAASWNSDTVFERIVVGGPARRSAFYWGQSGIRRIDCVADALARGGTGGMGSGDLKAGDVSGIAVEGGRISGFAVGDNWNFDGRPHDRVGCVTRDVTFTRCDRIISCYNVTPVRSAILDNRGSANGDVALLLTGARLLPSPARPDIGLIYDGNDWGGPDRRMPPAVVLPANSPAAETVLLGRNSRFIGLPPSGRAIAASPAKPGRHRLASPAGSVDFLIVAHRGTTALLRPVRLPVAGGGVVEVSVENGVLLLHQRAASPLVCWVKLSGPEFRGGNAG